MIAHKTYGPVSFDAPLHHIKATLKLSGVVRGHAEHLTHVFFDEVRGDNVEAMKGQYNYAGTLTHQKGTDTAELDVTEALDRAERKAPNFYITFLTEHHGLAVDDNIFDFSGLDIESVVPDYVKLDISADPTGGVVPGTHPRNA